MPDQPAMDKRDLVCTGIVQTQMFVLACGHRRLDAVQESPELGRALPSVKSFHDSPHLNSSAANRRSWLAAPSHACTARLGRDAWAAAVANGPELELGLLIHAQHQHSVGQIQIQAHGISDFFNELWILGDLEGFGGMRLQSKLTPDPADRTFAQPAATSHREGRPMRGVVRPVFQSQREHLLDGGVADLPRSPRAGLIEQPLPTPLAKAPSPLADRLNRQASNQPLPCYSAPRRRPAQCDNATQDPVPWFDGNSQRHPYLPCSPRKHDLLHVLLTQGTRALNSITVHVPKQMRPRA